MRQEEKTELTRERILQAAMREFGTNGYAATKVNTICCKYGIPRACCRRLEAVLITPGKPRHAKTCAAVFRFSGNRFSVWR